MDHNAHRNGIENTGSREYETAIRRMYDRMGRSNVCAGDVNRNDDNIHKTVEGVNDGKA
jgi:hypothetical protein